MYRSKQNNLNNLKIQRKAKLKLKQKNKKKLKKTK